MCDAFAFKENRWANGFASQQSAQLCHRLEMYSFQVVAETQSWLITGRIAPCGARSFFALDWASHPQSDSNATNTRHDLNCVVLAP